MSERAVLRGLKRRAVSERMEVVIWRVGSWGEGRAMFSVWTGHGGGCRGILFFGGSCMDRIFGSTVSNEQG